IEDQLDVVVGRHCNQLGELVLDAVDHLQRIGARLLHNWEIDRALPVDPDHVGLDHRRIHRLGHFLQRDRNTADHLHRDAIHVIDDLDHAVRVDVVIEVADLHVTGWEQHGLIIYGVDDFRGRNATGQHPFTIQEHCDLPYGSPEG